MFLRLSGGCLVVVRWLSGGCLVVVRWLSGGCLVVVRWLSGGCPVVVRWLSGGCLVVVNVGIITLLSYSNEPQTHLNKFELLSARKLIVSGFHSACL
jgi:hypothetical protein